MVFAPYETGLICRLKNCQSNLRATLLESPPGYGKSLILDAVYRHFVERGLPCVWLSLDGVDSSLDHFIESLINACVYINPQISVPEELRSGTRASAGRLAAAMLSSGAPEIFIDNLVS